ncbi:MAG: ABC transporter permease [Planctomycetota bacterium]
MLNYIVRRLLLLVPTLIGVTMVVFFVMANSPGGVGGSALSEEGDISSEQAIIQREYFNQRYGLDDPQIVQYARWLNRVSPVGFGDADAMVGVPVGQDDDGNARALGLKWPDLGESFQHRRPVLDLYAQALPITLLLNLVTLPISYVVAILAGVYAARHRGQAFDVASGATLLSLYSAPVIWVGVVLIGFLASNQYLQWFPASGLSSLRADEYDFLPSITADGWQRGWLLDRAWHLVLPVVCMVYGSFAVLAKLMRASVLESLGSDYVRTATAKGLSDGDVLWHHAFRNSLLPLITVAASIVPSLLAGSLVIEKIFSVPGMGLLTIDAIWARDRELVLAGALISGLLGLLSILVADLCYAFADPRVSYE